MNNQDHLQNRITATLRFILFLVQLLQFRRSNRQKDTKSVIYIQLTLLFSNSFILAHLIGAVMQTGSSRINQYEVSQECTLNTLFFLYASAHSVFTNKVKKLLYAIQSIYYFLMLLCFNDFTWHSFIIVTNSFFLLSDIKLQGKDVSIPYSYIKDDLSKEQHEMPAEKKETVNERKESLEDIEEEPQEEITRSRANDLLLKLRLIKYQTLIQPSPKQQLNSYTFVQEGEAHVQSSRDIIQTNNDEFRGRKHRKQNTLTQAVSSAQRSLFEKRQSDSGSRPSIQRQFFNQMDDLDIKLENDDIDDIIKILAGRKEQIWLPHFLRSKNNLKEDETEFSVEARQQCVQFNDW